jgi:hypothetical protein
MIKLLALKALLKKTKAYVKKYWKLIIGIVVVGFVYITSKSKVHSLAKALSDINDSHKKEVDTIENAHKSELRKIEKARATLASTMREIELKYADSEKKLNKKKRKEVEKIIKENHDDSETITKKLAELTGFKIYVE